jgi:hypothetical protein
VKLTQKGRDFLKATLIVAAISSLLGIKSMIALAFALAIAILISFVLLASVTMTETTVSAEPKLVRGFKGDEFQVTISMSFRRGRWISVHVASFTLPDGVIVRSQEINEGLVKLDLRAPYAGRFAGIGIELELWDTLGIFSKGFQSLNSQFVIESLPISLLATARQAKPVQLSIGERSARSPGTSMELYSLDEYQPYSETKNLLWKKIARMPDERLVVKVREATIPEIVKIGIFDSSSRTGQSRLRFADLMCEGVGALCNNLIAAGCAVEILSPSRELGVNSYLVTSLLELGDVLMGLLSTPSAPRDDDYGVIVKSDVIVTGLYELEDLNIANAVASKLSLLIEDENALPIAVGDRSTLFTGVEDVGPLVSKVLER